MKPTGSISAVDVVVLTIDRRDDIFECIDSVLAQDHPDVRLFVLDQGSDAATLADLEARSQRDGFTLHSGEKIGIAKGRNLGATLGNAPLIVSLDNDAVLSAPDTLSKAATILDDNPDLGVLAFAIHDYHRGGPDLSCWAYPWPHATHFQKSFTAARFMGGGHALRRNAFEAVGGYDPALFFFGEELDLAYALISAGHRIRYAPEVAIRHKASAQGRIDWSSGRLYHNVRNMLYINTKYFNKKLMNWQYAVGYLIKGALNGHPAQALNGVRDGRRLSKQLQQRGRLQGEALDYVMRHEILPRGSALERLRREVAVTMSSTLGAEKSNSPSGSHKD